MEIDLVYLAVGASAVSPLLGEDVLHPDAPNSGRNLCGSRCRRAGRQRRRPNHQQLWPDPQEARGKPTSYIVVFRHSASRSTASKDQSPPRRASGPSAAAVAKARARVAKKKAGRKNAKVAKDAIEGEEGWLENTKLVENVSYRFSPLKKRDGEPCDYQSLPISTYSPTQSYRKCSMRSITSRTSTAFPRSIGLSRRLSDSL